MAPALGTEGPSTKQSEYTPSVRDLEWAAGFLEGEGCFRHNSGSERVDVNQDNLEPLRRLLYLFGGRMTDYHSPNSKRGAIGRWYVCGSRARGVMMTLFPLLSASKQEDIRGALI